MAQVKDPVCGMMIDEKDAVSSSVYNGMHFYFCSDGCKTKFDQTPARYAGTSSGEPGGSATRT
ncbi:MAG: YHS domain-containing protein [Gemmatimonadaceae bacterium]